MADYAELPWWADAIHSRAAEIKRLREALEFYADPNTYMAVAFIADPPAGPFVDDFSDDHGNEFYDRPMPGKRNGNVR